MTNNARYFQKHQRELLTLANSDAGRQLLGIRDVLPIVKITPNSWHFLLGQDNTRSLITADFFCYEKAAKFLLPAITKMEIANVRGQEAFAHFAGVTTKSWKYPAVYLQENDYYTGAGDGYCAYNGEPTWSTAHNATSGNGVDYQGTTIENGVDHTDKYWIKRSFYPVDTSGLGGTATVAAAVFKTYAYAVVDQKNDSAGWLAVVQATQASPTALEVADYSRCGSIDNPTKGSADMDITSMSNNSYVNFTLNAAGLLWVNNAGFTKLGLRQGNDFSASDPGFGGECRGKNCYLCLGASRDQYRSPINCDLHAADRQSRSLGLF